MKKNISLTLAAAFVIVSVTSVFSVIGHIKFEFLDSTWMKIAHI